jgi:hypothetical protein
MSPETTPNIYLHISGWDEGRIKFQKHVFEIPRTLTMKMSLHLYEPAGRNG